MESGQGRLQAVLPGSVHRGVAVHAWGIALSVTCAFFPGDSGLETCAGHRGILTKMLDGGLCDLRGCGDSGVAPRSWQAVSLEWGTFQLGRGGGEVCSCAA